jgi:signal peptidase II
VIEAGRSHRWVGTCIAAHKRTKHIMTSTTAASAPSNPPLALGPVATFVTKQKLAWFVMILVSMITLDQVSKVWAQANLTELRTVNRAVVQEDGSTIKVPEQVFLATKTKEVIPGLFNFKYAENNAAAFSLTRSLPDWLRRPMLLTISALASVLISVWYFRLKQRDALLLTAFALIVAGAVGNLIDRARLAYVIDFLDVYISSPGLASWLTERVGTSHWPTFNVADMCIVVGAFAVLFRSFRPFPEEPAASTAQASS